MFLGLTLFCLNLILFFFLLIVVSHHIYVYALSFELHCPMRYYTAH